MDDEEPSSQKKLWRIIGASARGVDHEHLDLPNQDAFATLSTPAGFILLVADGAGSAPHAEEAARIVVTALLQAASAWPCQPSVLDPQHLRSALERCRANLERRAAEIECPIDHLACTAIVVVVCEGGATSAHVGDGAVVIDRGGELITLSPPEPSEHINGTSFLSMSDGLERVRYNVFEGEVSAAVAFSDGLMLRVLSYPEWEPHRPFFEPFLREVSAYESDEEAQMALVEFLASDFVREGSSDDLTLVAAIRSRPQ